MPAKKKQPAKKPARGEQKDKDVIAGDFKEEKDEKKEAAPSRAVAVRVQSPQEVAQWRPEFAKSDVDRAIVQVDEKRRFFDNVMKSGAHYAIIPGQRPTPRIDQRTGEEVKVNGQTVYDPPKPALLKPGAELLNAAMGLHPMLEDEYPPVMEEKAGEMFIQFRRVCRIYRQTGPGEEDRMLVAQASGECNSWEPKYRYRGSAGRVCPACGSKAIIKGNPKYAPRVGGKREGPVEPGFEQGGWLCWKKKDGCGTAFADADPRLTQQTQEREKNPDPMGIANTLLKMADKRALVAATLLATGCSDLFTQDIEEGMPEGGAPAPTSQAAGEDSEDPGPPSDAAPAPAAAAPKPAAPAPKSVNAESVNDDRYAKLDGWPELRLFHRYQVEHPDDPRAKLLRQYLNEHGLGTWASIAEKWETPCWTEKDKEYGATIGAEIRTLIMPLGNKPDQPLQAMPAGTP